VATALATSAWGRVRTGSVALGRLAGLLVVTTMLASELGRTGRPDMLASAFGTIGAWLVDRAALGQGRRSDPWFAGLALGAGLLSKGPIVLLVPALLLVLPRPGITLLERTRRIRPLVVLLVTVGLAALWGVPAWIREGGDFVKRLAVDQLKDRLEGKGNHLQDASYYVLALPPVLLPWAPFSLVASALVLSRRVRERLGPPMLPMVVLIVLIVLSAVPTKEVRYALILVPPLSIQASQTAALLVGRMRDRQRVARQLTKFGLFSIGLGLAATIPMGRWPLTIPSVAPPAAVAVLSGVLAILHARRAEPLQSLAGRWTGLAVVVIACGLCAFWGMFARYLVHSSVQENAAVAAVLPAGVPTVIVSRGGLDPEDFFDALPRAALLGDAAALPSAQEMPRLVVVCVSEDRAAVVRARSDHPSVLLERDRGDGELLVVLRFGP
jgi:4-amino-4-deoxy-L-arabinose transferase-like glycosyltransferase